MNFHRHFLSFGIVLLLTAVRAEEGLSHESAVWNAGVEACLAGDLTNAVEILRPIEGSKSHGARVAEVMAKAEYEAAKALPETNVTERLERLEAAARAAQTALRATPNDTRRRDNLALATARLPALREQRHLEEVLAGAAKKSPVSLLKKSRDDIRAVLAETERLQELPPADRIDRAEALERRTQGLADVCLVLREQARTQGGDEADQAVRQLDAFRQQVEEAARRLGDLQAEAEASVTGVEAGTTELYRSLLEAWPSLAESQTSQSNACRGVANIGRRGWQADALAYTQGFQAKFPRWAEQYETSCQTNTNAPPLTAECRQQIEALTAQLVEEQAACCQLPDAERQEKALDLVRRILALKPEPPNDSRSQQQQQQDQQQQQQDRQDQQQQGQQDQQQQDQQGQESPQDKQDERQGQEEESQPSEDKQQDQPSEDKQQDQPAAEEKQPAAEAEESDQEKADKDLLQRVLERSAESKDKASKARQKGASKGFDRDW